MRKTALSFSIATLLGVLSLGCGKPDPTNINADGTLAAGDSVLEQDNSFYDEYKFRAAAGWTITATMTSSGAGSFDTFLHLMKDGQQVATNDDDPSVGGTNSKITFAVTEAGEYTVLANSLQGGATGPYHIAITANGP
jgi:hypothetical protein